MKYSLILASLSLAATSCGNPHISSSGPGLETTTPPVTRDVDDVNGETTSGETTAGQTTSGQTTAGQTTAGQTTAGQTTAGQTTAGQTTAGQTTAGQTTAGQTTAGQTTTGTSSGSTSGTGSGCTPGSTEVTDFRTFFSSNAEAQRGQTPVAFTDFMKCKSVVTENFNPYGERFTKLLTNSRTTRHSYRLIHQVEKNNLSGREISLTDFFGTNTYSMKVENPVEQNGARGVDGGVDSHSANNKTKDALVWSFSSPVSFWGANVVDVESSPSEPALLRVYDCSRSLLKEMRVNYPGNEHGQKERHFIGIISARADICHISLTVGDYESPNRTVSKAFFRALAVDDFTYGK